MRTRYGTNVAFIDAILNSLMGISALFIISFLLINEDEDKITDVPEPPVQMLITMTWPTEGAAKDADMDLWLQYSPNSDDAVGFRSPVRDGIALERDDLGSRSDRYVSKGRAETQVIPINQEVIALRRIPEDELTVNAMYYYNQDGRVPVPCTIQVVKLNPYVVIYEGQHTLNRRGDEYTFIRFTMDESGQVIDRNFRQKAIVFAKPAAISPTDNSPYSGNGQHSFPSGSAYADGI